MGQVFIDAQALDRSMQNDTLKLPLTALKFLSQFLRCCFLEPFPLQRLKVFSYHKGKVFSKSMSTSQSTWYQYPRSALLRFNHPPDGMPCVRDWLVTWESMLMAGPDLAREPLSCAASTLH